MEHSEIFNLEDLLKECAPFNPDYKENLSINKQDTEQQNEDVKKEQHSSENNKDFCNFLFASFDICGSTELKTRFQKSWIKMVNVLLTNKLLNMNFWKFNGDEILYYNEVHSLAFVIKLIKEISRQVELLQNELKEIFKENIFIRATVWIARVRCCGKIDQIKNSEITKNFEFVFDNLRDYVGINMDEGFRLCSHASPRKVVVDPKLVYLFLESFKNKYYKDVYGLDTYLTEVKEVLQHTYFCNYVHCKGIWKNRLYPMYWYVPRDKEANIQYDECLDVDKLEDVLVDDIDKTLKKFERIFKTVDVFGEVTDLVASFRNYVAEDTRKNPSTGNILIAQRSEKRQHLKGVWDFGNVKFQKVNMPSYITKKYSEMFGIDIELSVNDNREGNIIPYQTCKIYRNCNPHNGILCHALIKTDGKKSDEDLIKTISHHIQDVKNNEEYCSVKFITLEQAQNIDSSQILTIDEIRDDSELAKREIDNSENTNGKYLMYVADSVNSANEFYKKKFNETNN